MLLEQHRDRAATRDIAGHGGFADSMEWSLHAWHRLTGNAFRHARRDHHRPQLAAKRARSSRFSRPRLILSSCLGRLSHSKSGSRRQHRSKWHTIKQQAAGACITAGMHARFVLRPGQARWRQSNRRNGALCCHLILPSQVAVGSCENWLLAFQHAPCPASSQDVAGHSCRSSSLSKWIGLQAGAGRHRADRLCAAGRQLE